MDTPVKIVSDFIDYYDMDSNKNGNLIFNRKISDSLNKKASLNILRNMGIPTIDVMIVKDIPFSVKNIVVYTDSKAHNGRGKMVCPREEAMSYFANNLGTPYIENTNGVYLKLLQVGTRRFKIIAQQNEPMGLGMGRVLNIEEISPQLSSITSPIFSIDYISVNGMTKAVDFNQTQKLMELGMERVISPEEVLKEVEKTLRIYKGLGE